MISKLRSKVLPSEVLPELAAKIDELVEWANLRGGNKPVEVKEALSVTEIRCFRYLLKDGGYRIRAAGPSCELYLEDTRSGKEFLFRLTSDGDYDPLH